MLMDTPTSAANAGTEAAANAAAKSMRFMLGFLL
jgi:hypothetical protein